jgi:tetratricopeptide (TPR) repeat protein
LVLVVASAAPASERSEVLTAKGEVAYAQNHDDEALRLLEQAVAADPDDPLAHTALGQVLLDVGRRDEAAAAVQRALAIDPTLRAAQVGMARARGEEAPAGAVDRTAGGTVGELGRLPSVRNEWDDTPWGLSVTTGLQYDTNVTVTPDGIVTNQGRQNDGAWVAAFGGEYNLIERKDFLLRFDYDLYQTVHFHIDDFNFRSQQPRLTASYGVTPEFWVGTEGGYNYYSLGKTTYQGEPYLMPFMSYLEGSWGLTQLIYRWGESTYFSRPFSGVRSGPNQTVNLGQTFYLPDDRYLTVGYQWYNENPTESTCSGSQASSPFGCPAYGNDWQYSSNQGYLGVGSPLPFGAFVDLLYLFRSDDYRWPNSYADYTKTRQDYGNYLYVGVTRPITDHISLAVTYYGTFNPSNIEDFQYNRNVVATLLQVTY